MLPFTLQQIRILKTVTIEKNFTKAAEILHLSQPYVSKQIKSLEQNLEVILLNRTTNKLSLTENGQVFLQYSDRILTLCEESCRVLIDLKNGDRGNLNIGASQTIGIYLIPQVLGLFAQNYPQINFNTIQVNSTRLLSQKILNQQIDIAIVDGRIPQNLKKKLKIKFFINDQLNLIVSKSHPFTKKKLIKKEDLYHLKFIVLNSSSTIQEFINNVFKKKNINIEHIKIIMKLNSIESIKTAVILDLGVAFVSSSVIEKEIKLETIKIIQIDNVKIIRKLFIISCLESYKSKAFNMFYNELFLLKNTIKNFTQF